MKHSYTCADARCPTCGKELTGASDLTDAAPHPDDISVCFYCAAVLVFNHDLTVRPATRDDIATLEPEAAWKLGQFVGAIHMRLSQGDDPRDKP